jgi:hypothetical protein
MQLEDLLLRHGAIDDAQLLKAREEQRSIGGDLGRHLVDLGFISEDLLLRALAHQLEIPLVDPSTMDLRAELLQAFPVQVCERFGVIAVEGDARSKRFRVATSDPGNRQHLVQVELATGLRLEPAAATAASIEAAVRRSYYGDAVQGARAQGPAIDFEAGERALSQAEGQEAGKAAAAAGAGLQLGKLTTTKRLRAPISRSQPVVSEASSEPLDGSSGEASSGRPPAGDRPAPERESGHEPLPEISIEAEPAAQVSFAELQALAQRVERLEAFVTQPQFAAVLARVERLEQIAVQLAQALRVVGGVLIDHELITLEEYRTRTSAK